MAHSFSDLDRQIIKDLKKDDIVFSNGVDEVVQRLERKSTVKSTELSCNGKYALTQLRSLAGLGIEKSACLPFLPSLYLTSSKLLRQDLKAYVSVAKHDASIQTSCSVPHEPLKTLHRDHHDAFIFVAAKYSKV